MPGAKEVTQVRVLFWMPWESPMWFRRLTKKDRCCRMSMLAEAFGAPPASVGGVRFAAMSSPLGSRDAAATPAAEELPTARTGGVTTPAAPLAEGCARRARDAGA